MNVHVQLTVIVVILLGHELPAKQSGCKAWRSLEQGLLMFPGAIFHLRDGRLASGVFVCIKDYVDMTTGKKLWDACSHNNQLYIIKTMQYTLYNIERPDFPSSFQTTVSVRYMYILSLLQNDIWQAQSWASIEYSGRWKLLHYFMKQVYKQWVVSPYMLNGNISIYVVVDDPAASMAYTLTVQVISWQKVIMSG